MSHFLLTRFIYNHYQHLVYSFAEWGNMKNEKISRKTMAMSKK